MSISTFRGDFINVSLHQLDVSKIKAVSGKQFVVNFDLENSYKLTYVFSVTSEKRFYLQRVEPYPMVHGEFSSETDVMDFIKRDSAAFRNARNSRNYPGFVDTIHNMLALTENAEQLFIGRNVSKEDLALLQQECGRLGTLIQEIGSRSPAILPE